MSKDERTEVEGHTIWENVNEAVVQADDEAGVAKRLAANTNETAVEDDTEVEGDGSTLQTNEAVVEDDTEISMARDETNDVEAHTIWDNVNEAVVEDEADVEGHIIWENVNETVVEEDEIAVDDDADQ